MRTLTVLSFVFAIVSCGSLLNEESAAINRLSEEAAPTVASVAREDVASTEANDPLPRLAPTKENTIALEKPVIESGVKTHIESTPLEPTATAAITPNMENTYSDLTSIPFSESILLIAGKNNNRWQVSTFPSISTMNQPEFESFYGEVAQAEDLWLYFLNFFPQQSFDRNWISLPGIGGYDAPNGNLGSGLWLIDIQGNEVKQVLPQAEIVSWSPNQNQFAYVSKNGLFLWSSEVELPQQILALSDNLDPIFLKWSPDGEKIAGMEVGSNGEESYWVYSLGQQKLKQLVSLPASLAGRVVSDFTWSPDSQFLLVRKHNKIIDIVSGEAIDIVLGENVGWLPSNFLIKFSEKGIMITDPLGTNITQIDIDEMLAPSISPDGKKIAYGAIKETGNIHIYLVSLEDSSIQEVGNIDASKIKFLRTIQWSLDGQKLYADDFSENTPIWYHDLESNSGISTITDRGLLISLFSR